MADVVEHHHTDGDRGTNSMAGVIVAILLIALVLLLFFIFGRGFFQSSTTTPTVEIPDQIDVNVDGGSGGGQ